MGGIFFIKQEYSSSKIIYRDFIIAKGSGKNLYNFELPFKKGMKIFDIAKKLINESLVIKKIYLMKNRKWTNVESSKKIYQDIHIKVTTS
ncbi:MAG: hypothetical protein HRT99_02165 [Mycoplasmatales bacterium]|nr:hypothetical protein [Mycoplasmatales bacterium]